MASKKKTVYLVWYDIDYEGSHAQEFDNLRDARAHIKKNPIGDRYPAILTKVI